MLLGIHHIHVCLELADHLILQLVKIHGNFVSLPFLSVPVHGLLHNLNDGWAISSTQEGLLIASCLGTLVDECLWD